MSARMRTLGETLRHARLDMGVSLDDAAQDTRIRRSYLEALEAEDFNALPPSVYTRGFVRTYAEYLGLNPRAMVDLYQPQERREREPSPQLRPAVPRVAVPRSVPVRPILLAGLAVAVVVVLVVAWNLYQGMAAALREGDNERTLRPGTPTALARQPTINPLALASPSPSPALEPTVAPAPAVVAEASPSPTAVVDGILVEFRAVSAVYVEASVDGQQVLAETVPAGTQRALPLGKNVVIMRVSKGNAIQITVNGKPQDPSPQTGVVEFTWRR